MRQLPMTEPAVLPVGVGVVPQTSEDGRIWVGLQFSTPLSTYVVCFPPEHAEALAQSIAKVLTDGADHVRTLQAQAATSTQSGTPTGSKPNPLVIARGLPDDLGNLRHLPGKRRP